VLQPERIKPDQDNPGYNVKSDVWSLGITLVTTAILSTLQTLAKVLCWQTNNVIFYWCNCTVPPNLGDVMVPSLIIRFMYEFVCSCLLCCWVLGFMSAFLCGFCIVHFQIELATGKHPYSEFKTVFLQMQEVIEGKSPQLPASQYSEDFQDFVNCW